MTLAMGSSYERIEGQCRQIVVNPATTTDSCPILILSDNEFFRHGRSTDCEEAVMREKGSTRVCLVEVVRLSFFLEHYQGREKLNISRNTRDFVGLTKSLVESLGERVIDVELEVKWNPPRHYPTGVHVNLSAHSQGANSKVYKYLNYFTLRNSDPTGSDTWTSRLSIIGGLMKNRMPRRFVKYQQFNLSVFGFQLRVQIVPQDGDEGVCNVLDDAAVLRLQVYQGELPSEGASAKCGKSSKTLGEKWGFERVVGQAEVLRYLRLHVVLPLMYHRQCLKLGIECPRGFLFYGAPGCGKTYLVQALLEELQHGSGRSVFDFLGAIGCERNTPVDSIVLFTLDASTLISGSLFAAQRRVQELFATMKAQAAASCTTAVLFIDEIEMLLANRRTASEAVQSIVTTFLTELDGLNAMPNAKWGRICLIGTTNDPTNIDLAMRRPGRIDREIEISMPSLEDRKILLTNLLRPYAHRLSNKDFDELSERTPAFIPADLITLIKTASISLFEECLINASAVTPKEDCENSVKREVENDNESESKVQVDRDDEYKVVPTAVPTEPPVLSLRHLLKALDAVRPSALRSIAVDVPRVQWAEVGGQEDVKQALRECIEWPIKYRDTIRALDIETPKGLLLFGPPGCAKTMLAKAVATEARMNFVAVKGPEIFSQWVGESERAVRELFRKARQSSPCIVFLDEVDAIAAARRPGEAGVEDRVVAQLLNEMDGICIGGQIVVIGATNRPESLDRAFIRPGRLDRLVYVPPPDKAARLAMIRNIFKKQKVEIADDVALAEKVAQATAGYTGAEIVQVFREASMMMLRQLVESRQCKVTLNEKFIEEGIRAVTPRSRAEDLVAYERFAQSHGYLSSRGSF